MKLILIFLMALSSFAFAENTYTSVGISISRLTAHSAEESIYPHAKSVVQITANGNFQWNNNSCDTSHVFIRGHDQHIIDMAKLAFINNKAIRVYADSTMPKLEGQFCYLRAISIQ